MPVRPHANAQRRVGTANGGLMMGLRARRPFQPIVKLYTVSQEYQPQRASINVGGSGKALGVT
jgi:hypothetical protein